MYYDPPTRIMEIIKENPKAYKWKQLLDNLIIERVGKEKIIKMNKKRWKEHLMKNEYKISPTQEYYYNNEVKEWKQY